MKKYRAISCVFNIVFESGEVDYWANEGCRSHPFVSLGFFLLLVLLLLLARILSLHQLVDQVC